MISDEERWDIIHKKTHKEYLLHSRFADDVEKSFPRGSIVVDIGGGTGSDAIYFLRKGHKVVILDISSFALKTALDRARLENLSENLVVKKVDIGLDDIPIKTDSVDIVYSRISLNYFGSKHTTKLIRDIYTMLKKGGKSYLSFKSNEDATEMEYLKNVASLYEENVFIENGQLRSRFSASQLEEICRNAGIINFKVDPYREDLSEHRKGHQNILYTNVISFSKD